MSSSDEPRLPTSAAQVPSQPPLQKEPKPVDASQEANGSEKVRWKLVLGLAAAAAVIGVVAVAMIFVVDTDALLEDLTRPKMTIAHGQVTWRGQPLANAQIVTQPADKRGRPSLGWTDEEGKFSLKTDIRGAWVEGATVGEHRVAVTVYEQISAPAAPPLLTPPQYQSPGTSPLTIRVERNPEENEFQLVLEGDPPARPKRPANAPPPSPPAIPPLEENPDDGQEDSERPAETPKTEGAAGADLPADGEQNEPADAATSDNAEEAP